MPDLFGNATDTVTRSALISDCGRYRYWLRRVWDGDSRLLCWVMLNPSVADASQDDPTIRRCISFSRAWGYTGLIVVNLFAWRATDPSELPDAPRAVGSDNDDHIRRASWNRDVIVAWGALRKQHVRRAVRTMVGLNEYGASVQCLERTVAGHPRHPLYVRGDVRPAAYREVPDA